MNYYFCLFFSTSFRTPKSKSMDVHVVVVPVSRICLSVNEFVEQRSFRQFLVIFQLLSFLCEAHEDSNLPWLDHIGD